MCGQCAAHGELCSVLALFAVFPVIMEPEWDFFNDFNDLEC
jgi:hypothetical protein